MTTEKNACLDGLTDMAVSVYGTRRTLIFGPSRARDAVRARCFIAWALREDGWTLAAIGEALGGRAHTTAMDAIRQFERGLGSGSEWAVRGREAARVIEDARSTADV